MTNEPNLPRPETRSQSQAGPQAEAQPSPQNDAIPLAGNVSQSHAGTAPPAETRAPFDLRRLRPGDMIAGIASFLVLISLFIPWYSFAAAAAQASAHATPAQQQLVLAICSDQPTVCPSDVPPQFSVSALGGGAGGWRFLILVVAIIVVLYVLNRALEAVARAVPYHWQMLRRGNGMPRASCAHRFRRQPSRHPRLAWLVLVGVRGFRGTHCGNSSGSGRRPGHAGTKKLHVVSPTLSDAAGG